MLKDDCRVRASSLGSACVDKEGALIRRLQEVLVDVGLCLPGSARVVGDIDSWKGKHELATK
jgi:hypothetical protein